MFAIFLTPYFFLIAMTCLFGCYLITKLVIGIGMAGIGMNVMHDGNHGSYSNKSWINKIMGGSIYILLEMFTTGKYNTMFYTTLTLIFMVMMKI
jgi:linoleoyl-CoA desaturase